MPDGDMEIKNPADEGRQPERSLRLAQNLDEVAKFLSDVTI